jgi:methionine synthase (B12-dependent) (EC 2.1.1.13)
MSALPEHDPGLWSSLARSARERILLLDGAMGSMLQRYRLEEGDFRAERFAAHGHDLKGNNDLLVLTQPAIVAAVHRAYLEAGADFIETNTFNANAISQADYALESLSYELNHAAARLAKTLCLEYSDRTPDQPRYAIGVLGPTNRTASISPDVNNPGFRAVHLTNWSPPTAKRPRDCWTVVPT